ncbi:universal stress protein [Haladaptatus sp. T7]|uniref:universal stress protein n=1 Tax=Haladaptatus sp. T7 TaxID=2029368 RepID=UPI0021A25202|nr:universal stress protein [Haladaptatus sp. T7]GKZ14694.1 universal stress protein [Haladaptatus sp. T7]
MYDDILIPTDGSRGATAGARHGLNLARAFDSRVHLLSVVDERAYSARLVDIDRDIREHREALEDRAEEALDELADLAADANVQSERVVEHGIPSEAIRSFVDDRDIDLVSMGTHGRTGLDRYLLGSVTERVIRTSDVPVLTSREAAENERSYDAILLPTDGSDAAAGAVEHGLAIAERYGATVHALSVVDVRQLTGMYETDSWTPRLLDVVEEARERSVEGVAERAKDRGLDVVTHVEHGIPSSVIREYVPEQDIDLVAMGTHGRTGLDRYLIGSVTERTIRTSDVPVLTVHHRE